jgi:hypothetical protein
VPSSVASAHFWNLSAISRQGSSGGDIYCQIAPEPRPARPQVVQLAHDADFAGCVLPPTIRRNIGTVTLAASSGVVRAVRPSRQPARIDRTPLVPILFRMAVETLGEAYQLGWQLTARCAFGSRDGMKSIRECKYRAPLDMQTLVWTREPNFPLSRLESRLMCPQCGSRRVAVLFQVPPQAGRATLAGSR